jgi:hypothetical protein
MQSPYVIGAVSMMVALMISLKVPPLQAAVQPKVTV